MSNNMDITIHLKEFKKFLENSWPEMTVLLSDENGLDSQSLDNWLQANWEQLVEQVIFHSDEKYLLEYGNGADYGGKSNRVFLSEVEPTHEVFCNGISGKNLVDLFTNTEVETALFCSFVSWNGEQYDENPPFNFVLAELDESSYLFELDKILFRLAPMLSTV